MSMSSDDQDLSLVRRFFALSSEKANQPVVARRGTIPPLMRFMAHNDREVKTTALKTVERLSSHPENPTYLCQQKGLVSLLFGMYKETEGDDPELHELIAAIFQNLRPALAPCTNNENDPSGGARTGSPLALPRRVRDAFATVRRHQNIALSEFSCMISTEAVSGALDELLQTTRGITSYTIDLERCVITLYTTAPTATLLRILEDGGLQASVESELVLAQPNAASEPSCTPPPGYITHRSCRLPALACAARRGVEQPCCSHSTPERGKAEEAGARLQPNREHH